MNIDDDSFALGVSVGFILTVLGMLLGSALR